MPRHRSVSLPQERRPPDQIVGPSFTRVCSWAEQGIPFKIACQGIDAYFVGYYAKGVRRRPAQIDFCENDILDAFDAWRRAVGVRPCPARSRPWRSFRPGVASEACPSISIASASVSPRGAQA